MPSINIQEAKGRSKLEVSNNAGGSISQFPVEFTKDSKYLFSSVNCSVNVYSSATGAVVKVLSQSTSTGGHSDKITCVILNPKNPLQLYTASLDGTIKLWDYNDNILLKTYHVRSPIKYMVMSPNTPNYAYIAIKPKIEGESMWIVSSFKFSEDSVMRTISTAQNVSSLDVTNDGQYLAYSSKNVVHMWQVNEDQDDVDPSQLTLHKFTDRVAIIKFHPDRPILAVGDQSGKIIYLTNYNSPNPRDHIQSAHHWHSTAVRSLYFMPDGSYLLSGGEEAVMVIWQLETGHKQFLPRMGGSITYIKMSPNNRFYCVGLGDNSIRLINSITQEIEQVIQGLQYLKHVQPLSTGMVIEPRNQHVVMNGIPGNLQFYNARLDSHVMDFEVVPMNRVLRSGDTKVVETLVKHVSFSLNGEWMATVDVRDDHITTPELFLKFWQWNPDTQEYKLHTRVDYPHTKTISSLTFGPGPIAITTSEDKSFKVWSLTNQWICRSVGVYRDLMPLAAAFSNDGSILAVSFGPTITLWDPYLNSIQAVLSHSSFDSANRLYFLGQDSPFMVTVSKTTVSVWNLLTCNIWWSYKIEVDHIAVDSRSNYFAVARNQEGKTRLIVFDPKSNIPVALEHLKHTSLSIAWIPRDDAFGASDILVLNKKYEMTVHSIGAPQEVEVVVQKEVGEERKMLNEMFGERHEERETEEQRRIRLTTAQQMRQEAMVSNRKETKARKEEGTLAAPSHVLPQVDSLFDIFMSSLVALRIENEQPVAMDLDETSEKVEKADEITQETIINEPQVDLPSLLSYLATDLGGHPLDKKAIVVAHESSSDEESDEEDPSNIDW